MPQSNPMNWMLIMTMTFISLVVYTMFYMFYYVNNNKKSFFNLNLNKFKMLW